MAVSAHAETLALKPYQAVLCRLAFVKLSALDEDHAADSAEMVCHELLGKKFLAKVEYRIPPNDLRVTLLDPETRRSVNAQLVQSGVVRVDRRPEKDFAETVRTCGVACQLPLPVGLIGVHLHADDGAGQVRGRRATSAKKHLDVWCHQR